MYGCYLYMLCFLFCCFCVCCRFLANKRCIHRAVIGPPDRAAGLPTPICRRCRVGIRRTMKSATNDDLPKDCTAPRCRRPLPLPQRPLPPEQPCSARYFECHGGTPCDAASMPRSRPSATSKHLQLVVCAIYDLFVQVGVN